VTPLTAVFRKIGRAIALAAFFAREMLVANLRVAADVITPHSAFHPAVVAIPLDVTSDAEILLLSTLINITPGSVTIDLSDDRRTLFVHVMHMTSPEATRLEIKTGFEQRVKRLFE
jgi:multicomponent Na+:H+ antiporter subunit E